MNFRALMALLLAALPAAGSAGEIEIEGRFGQALPTYEQSYAYAPGTVSVTIPGLTTVNFEQRSPFTLKGQGGTTFGASFTLYPASSIGLEARFDSPAVKVEAQGAVYRVSANLPAPLPDLAQDLAIDSGTVDIDRLQPLSLNLKLRTPGKVAFTLSGGVSYLPTIRISAQQPIRFGDGGGNPLLSQLSAGRVSFRAAILPENDEGSSRIGGNLGAGFAATVGPRVRLTGDVRIFAFPKHRLDWEPVISGPLSIPEQALYDAIRPRLEPIEFNPTFFQATIGLAVRL
jgi:hypothetical protein